MNDDFLNFLKSRGYYNQCTNEIGLTSHLKKKSVGYIGFDCTADSLHVGSLLPLMILRHFQKFGHRPIILIGGGTTLVGDPSGKDETRKILDKTQIDNNKNKLKKIFERFISFDQSKKNSAIFVDNYSWLSNLKYIEFLREIGSKFSVNKMISLESSKQRLNREQNLSFLEFNYSILQAFDFFELFKEFNCTIQFGGSDQWGNIVSGIDLIKKIKQKETYGITSPLVTTSDGKKMGKTNDGAVWLSENKFSIKSFWQYWRNTSDDDVIKFLNYFTEIESSEIKKFNSYQGSDLNKLKILLANEVTTLCHGAKKSKKAELEAQKIFVKKDYDNEIIKQCENKILLKKKDLTNKSIKQILVDLRLCSSNGEAKRLILQGAVKINENIISEHHMTLQNHHFKKLSGQNKIFYSIIFVGKKKYGVVELVS